MTLGEWMHEEEQRLMDGIESWKEFQERENKAESEVKSMGGYDLADEVFNNIGMNENHEISLDDTLRVISFFGFNEEADRTSKIGFVCYCARERIKKTFESALVYNNFALFDEMVKICKEESRDKDDKRRSNQMVKDI